MTSFASAFGSSDQDENHSEKTENNSLENPPQGANHFSSIDLDQQPTTPQSQSQHSAYVSLTDAATFRTDPPITSNPAARIPSSSSQDLPPKHLTNPSDVPVDRRISIPDMSKISASSAAAVAAVGPTIDKLKQWSRLTYKCTKQALFEKLGKTSRTVDVEVDSQVEV